MAKCPSIAVRLEPEVKVALEKAAHDDARTISSMAQKIFAEWLKAKKYLK